MDGLMQDWPLTTNALFRRGVALFGGRTVETRRADGAVEQVTFAEVAAGTRRMAGVLDELGLSADARVGTFGWNTAQHVMAYFAVPGTGRVLHTMNLRLFAEQLIYTVQHAQDEAIFVDRSLVPLLAPHLSRLESVRHVLVWDDGSTAELPDDPRARWYDEVAAQSADVDFDARVTDENRAAGLCYTTGTTGDPKGVLYSHRSTFLHAFCSMTTAAWGLTDRDKLLPIVPMFHAMAWGFPYAAFFTGSSLVMPGPDLSPDAVLDLIQRCRVTQAAGVPTIWMGVLPLLEKYDVSSLSKIMCGGSAVPTTLSEAFRAAIGIPITQGWGMTETSPIAAISTLRAEVADADDETKARVRAAAGLAMPGVELRIVDSETGAALAWDDEAAGELEVGGPWIARQYYRTEAPGDRFAPDGWLRTGDVASISPLGYIRIVDRTKDLIKSGGEWISSVDLENRIMAHPDVIEAAVIAMPHPKWMERPMACVVRQPDAELDAQGVLAYLREQGVEKWGLPDDVVFIDEVPKTSVGKFSKRDLRARFADHQLPTV
jgi:fatty-acyl-CoA synthase